MLEVLEVLEVLEDPADGIPVAPADCTSRTEFAMLGLNITDTHIRAPTACLFVWPVSLSLLVFPLYLFEPAVCSSSSSSSRGRRHRENVETLIYDLVDKSALYCIST